MMVEADAAGRARTGALLRGLTTSLLGRGIALATPLILIPVLYRYFGSVQYGLYATVVSLTSMFVWADLGLGNGLLTKLSAALADGDRALSRRLISAAYSTLFLVSLVLVAGVVLSPLVVPWDRVLGMKEADDAALTVVICFGLLFLNVPLSLVQRVQYAAQRVATSNLLQLVSPAFVLAMSLIGVWNEWSYSAILFGISSGPVLASLVASAVFYGQNPDLRPQAAPPLDATGRSLLQLGVGFLAIQISSAVAMNVDILIAAHTLDAERLADFSATLRLFLVLGGVVTVTMLPLWPANADALARGDVAWVRRTTRRMIALGLGTTLALGVLLTGLGPLVLPVVLGESYEVDSRLMIGLTLQWCLVAAASPFFMLQNSVGELRTQFVAWPAFLLLAVPSKWFVASRLDAAWLPYVGSVMYASIVFSAAVLGARLALRGRAQDTPRTIGRRVPSRRPRSGDVNR